MTWAENSAAKRAVTALFPGDFRLFSLIAPLKAPQRRYYSSNFVNFGLSRRKSRRNGAIAEMGHKWDINGSHIQLHVESLFIKVCCAASRALANETFRSD